MKQFSVYFHRLRNTGARASVTLCLILLCVSCGKKGDPHPIETLNIPPPVWVEISFEEDAVHITNSSYTYQVLAERAESEIGDLFLPVFNTLASIKPQGRFTDNNTRRNVRYIYRIRTIHGKYEAYSEPITKVVSYKGAVAVESLQWRIEQDELCMEMVLSRDVANHRIMINGRDTDISNRCHPLPNTPSVLLVVIPYSDSGLPGRAYSEVIDIKSAAAIFPPQNIRIIRMERQITLSWQAVSGAEIYEIRTADEKGNAVIDRTEATIYNSEIIFTDKCTEYTLVSIGAGIHSEPIKVQSCP